jgi:hypothetical protein
VRRFPGKMAALGASLLLGACATPPSTPPDTAPDADWHMVSMPGKKPTHYARVHKGGRPAWHAQADVSASMWRRRVHVEAARLGEVEFAWWVPALNTQAVLGSLDSGDAPARVLFSFAGDEDKLSARNRMMFELARTLSGESPPYATLMYVWDNQAPVGSVIVHPRFDRIRKLVVESGDRRLGTWLGYKRDLVADYRRAFGEEPGDLTGIAIMTDADNTRSRSEAWYGEIVLAR